MTTLTKPSSNWLALQKSLVRGTPQRKRRKIDRGGPSTPLPENALPLQRKRREPDIDNHDVDFETTKVKNSESIATLRKMVLGVVGYKTLQTAPGKYLALDCEMVGVGIEGSESSLARVSIVNYAGTVILDAFVRQRERVVDYRTKWSGVRSDDLIGSAKPFKEVQQTVAELIKDRVLIGHAIHNDLKALLLSHPFSQTRDIQSLAYKHRIVKSRRPALRVLVKQELGITIQGGEHSSITDARATMALFRLHKKQFESRFWSLRASTVVRLRPEGEDDNDSASRAGDIASPPSPRPFSTQGRKRGRSQLSEPDDDTAAQVVQALGSSLPAPLSPPNSLHTRSSTQDAAIVPKPRKHGKSPPSSGSAHQKWISPATSITARGTGSAKKSRRNMPRVTTVVENMTGKTGAKWWKSFGEGKKGSIKL